ncbi:phosphoesterase [Petrotoga sp. 9PW.55.5.1]|uniref:PHP domain-containing protein n=1 Tax=Petrotoga sp. 9PW.55.5.1 TaxID=1308979 RepID=UPI000DC4CD24|nr:PHP domain-containing protein [Petrotoga sp. 9PW.55.5.1]RAO99979.1 phosphoesterase [Petrotoga sp. 9PW.55.5.1]
MKVDFHVHSTGSDGTNTPFEIIHLALNAGIKFLSITDHDTLDGVKMIQEGKSFNEINFIVGVEISAEFPSTLHLLGYGFDLQNEKLNSVLNQLQECRKKRNFLMIENMQRLGFQITLQELNEEAKGDLIGRPHFASLMLKKRYVNSKQEAFDKYLKKGAPLYLDKKRLNPNDAISLIKEARGVVVLAHPYQTNLDEKELEELVKKLKNYGLDGIEAYYSKHTQKMTEKYQKLAKKYDLVTTAGSDYHGDNKKDIKLGIEIKEEEIRPFLDILRRF